MLYAIVALLVIILDQWSKFWVAQHIAYESGSKVLIPGLLNLVNIHNDGAALGLLSGKNAGMLFIILCAVFTIFVIIALATKLIKSSVGRWSLLFIMAGGLSNCIDRLLSGYVQDMFMPTFMDKLPIFNVADIFITVFCLVFILFVLFGGKRDDDYDDEDEEEDEYEEEDEEEDVEYEEEPARDREPRGLGALFGSRARDDEDEDEDEEEEDDEEDEDEVDEKPRGLFAKLRSRARDDEDEDEDEEEEDDEDEEEEEEEELPPARRPSRYDRAARNGRSPAKHTARKPSRDEDEDEDEEEEEADEAPVLRRPKAEKKEKAAAPKRSSRRDRQAELDEKYARFKAERAAREQQWSAPEEETPVVDPSDPFAEWDRAAREAEKSAPAAEKIAPEVEAPKPAAPKQEPKDESPEFSLEDILAEFK